MSDDFTAEWWEKDLDDVYTAVYWPDGEGRLQAMLKVEPFTFTCGWELLRETPLGVFDTPEEVEAAAREAAQRDRQQEER